jgi:hypothetical protein
MDQRMQPGLYECNIHVHSERRYGTVYDGDHAVPYRIRWGPRGAIYCAWGGHLFTYIYRYLRWRYHFLRRGHDTVVGGTVHYKRSWHCTL